MKIRILADAWIETKRKKLTLIGEVIRGLIAPFLFGGFYSMNDNAQDKLVLNLTNEIRDVLQKHLAKENRETITYAHIAIASFVLGCELACTEQEDIQAVIDTTNKLAREYSDTIFESN